MISIDKYKEGYAFPSRDRNPESKKEKYCLANAEAIYSLYLNGKTAWGYGRYNHFDIMRQYSTGQQDTEQYKTFLLNTATNDTSGTAYTSYDDLAISKTAKRQGWYNVLWQNLSPAPRILSTLLGKMEDIDYDVYVDMVDSESKGLEEQEKWIKYHEAKDAKWINEFKTNAGIPVDEPVDIPANPEELESYQAKEGFKLNIAKAMQKLLRSSFQVSDWDTVIARKVRDDLLTVGYGATRDYYDEEDCRFKTKWIDPARMIVQHSHEFDFNDAEYAGYFSLWTISNLRNKVPQVSEQELFDLAKCNQGKHGNPDFMWSDQKAASGGGGYGYKYDDFKVWVLETEWIDTNYYRKLYYESTHGRKSVTKVGWEEGDIKEYNKQKKRKNSRAKAKETKVRQVYSCCWIVDTDYVFDWGPVNMAARPKMTKPKLSFHVEQLLSPSLVYQMRPVLDQIAITWVTHQNSVAQMVERGYAINISMIKNVTIGGKILDPAQVLNMWKQSGFLPYQYSFQGPYQGGAASPITPIDGGLGNRVKETADQLTVLFGVLEKITGLNPVALGESPQGESTLGETQMSVQAMSDALRPAIQGFFDIKKSVAESIANRMQIGIRVSEKIRKILAGVTSPSDIQAMKMAENRTPAYGMDLKVKPDIQIKQTLMQFIQVALTDGRNGQPGLRVPEALDFTMRIERGEDLDEIRQEIDYAVKKSEERAHQMAMEKIDRQNQGLAAVDAQAHQGKMEEIMAEGQIDKEEEEIRAMQKQLQQRMENNQKLYEMLYEDAMAADGLRQTNKTQ